jgi:hypothetical protein
MQMTTESGHVVDNVGEAELLDAIDNEQFVILATSEFTFLQCAEPDRRDGDYVLEYQDGSLDKHFCATDKPLPIERVQEAFVKYLNGDPTWQIDFDWEKMNL